MDYSKLNRRVPSKSADLVLVPDKSSFFNIDQLNGCIGVHDLCSFNAECFLVSLHAMSLKM